MVHVQPQNNNPSAAGLVKRADEPDDCSGEPTLTGEGVGIIRVGAGQRVLQKACPAGRVKSVLDDEANPEKVFAVRIRNAPVKATIADGRVWSVVVEGAGLTTPDKIGVGSSLADLRKVGKVTGTQGEGGVYASSSSHCGMSFELSYQPKDGEDHSDWTAAEVARLPANSKITRIVMFGCKTR